MSGDAESDEAERNEAERNNAERDDATPDERDENHELVEELLDGKHRALARVITKIENRAPGYRDLVSELHDHTGHAEVVGITGSPGAGKSTLVDKMANIYRERGETVGVIAVDPSSPFTGGAVLGDRIRMASNVGDMDVFFRSMSARGRLGGLSTATTDAVKALDAFGKDKILVETVGAGQNEIDVVKTADTVVVLVPPGSGDNVQMLKAGILEIGDVFVVNKADLDGADRTVQELEEMIHMQDDRTTNLSTGHHGAGSVGGAESEDGSDTTGETEGGSEADDESGEAESDAESEDAETWQPQVVETVAKDGDGVEQFLDVLADHHRYLTESGLFAVKARTRYADEIRNLIRDDASGLLEAEIERQGGIEELAERVFEKETDPYSVADGIIRPLEECLDE